MYSPPSTPSWAKGDAGSPVSDYAPRPKPRRGSDHAVFEQAYPDEKYKQSPIHTPNVSWGLRSYQAQSALPHSDMDSDYPVQFDPVSPTHAYTDINRGYASMTVSARSDANPGTQAETGKAAQCSQTRGNVRPLDLHGSFLEIPEIPLVKHDTSDVFLRERNRLSESNESGEDIYLQSGKGLPYSTIYSLKRAIPDPRSPGFIPGAAVAISVIDVLNTDLMGRPSKNYTYAIKVSNGECEWILRKTFQQWRHLHTALKGLQRKLAGDLGEAFPGYAVKTDTAQSGLPRFPTTERENISVADLPGRMHGMTAYLQYVVGNSTCLNHVAVKSFLEISPYSLVYGLGSKMKEGYVTQRVCEHPLKPFPVSLLCGNMADGAKWLERWLVVKETFVMLVDPFDASIQDVVLADANLQVDGGLKESGVPRGISLKIAVRRLIVQCLTDKDVSEFVMELTFMKHVTARDYVDKNPHDSFAPLRKNCQAKWLVDGKAYYKAIADALDEAKEEIFICGWWISPELQLKRPVVGFQWRLDNLLARKAAEGVRVFILLYYENNLTDFLNSAHTKKTLEDLYPGRVRVICHPNQGKGAEKVMWYHNEKIVVVDQSIAFFGGMDLCFGQWDNYEHR